MRNSTTLIAYLALLIVSACSSSSSITPAPLTTPTPRCKDDVCIQQVVVLANDTGDLFIHFVLTDQAGKVDAAHPPVFTQDWLSTQVYRLEPDQTEKVVFDQLAPGTDYSCDVSTKYQWAIGQPIAVCGLYVPPAGMAAKAQTGDRLRVKLVEFDFEQVVEVNSPATSSTDNQSGNTRIVLAVANCPGTTPTDELVEQLKTTGKIIANRLRASEVERPFVQIGDCQIEVKLSPADNPASLIDLIQQRGRFELIDSNTNYYDSGTILRTTGSPTPTMAISTEIQSTTPATLYAVIATGADVDQNQLMVVMTPGNKSPQLSLTFKGTAVQRFAQVTTAYSESVTGDAYFVCLLIDNVVQNCPQISDPITDGRGVIGFDDYTAAHRLASLLRFGELPLELHVVKTETIR